MPSKLYLIPAFLSAEQNPQTMPPYIWDQIKHVRHFFVEHEKSARSTLKKIVHDVVIQDCKFFPLNEHTAKKDLEKCFKEWKDSDVGVISEAGVPCVADPGAQAVMLAHQSGMEVIPLIGPSSIILALMASGLNGQNFAFHGYLPKDKNERLKKIKLLEQAALRDHQTQIFMETPYHNQSLLEDIISACSPNTLLSVSADLTAPGQFIKTSPVGEWKRTRILAFNKKPALFLIGRLN